MGKDTKNGITHYGKGHTKRYHTPWERTYKTASHTMGKDIQNGITHYGKGHTNGITLHGKGRTNGITTHDKFSINKQQPK